MVGERNWKIVFGIFIVILGLTYALDNYISKTEIVLYERLESSIIKEISEVARNIDLKIKEDTLERNNSTLYEYFQNKPNIRKIFENQFSLFINSKIKYLYLVYKDDQQKFRFLLDGSVHDKARYNQKIDVKSDEYYSVYENKKAFVIKQKSLEKLSLTYLYPIKIKDKVEALLVFDFSNAFENELKNILAPLKNMFILIYASVGLFLIVTTIQALLYYHARKRSYIDVLTGVFNRQYLRYFLDENDLANYKIMMIDFDHFKKINDNYGHVIGDTVLVFGTKLIQSCIKSNDQLFRYGGEEFLVLVHKDNELTKVAELIRLTIEKAQFVQDNVSINITVSIGVNPLPSYTRNTAQAINIADSMLYKAKTQGRNKVVFYNDKMITNIDEKHSDAHNIHHVVEALDANRVICHFHKIINLKQEVYKYEALVRYITGEGKIVFPNHFLSDIAHTKVYTDLTKRVIDICIVEMQSKNIDISLNWNVNDLLNTVLVEYLVQKINKLTSKDASLTIEILENEEIKNMDELQLVIEKLQKYGIRFAIDDFGSGYANFNYLVGLNLDYIKIDGSLVEKSVVCDKSKNIVKSIIDLAHIMGIKTIVEFVSLEEVYDVMVTLETDYMQGFFISKPESEIL